MIVALWGLLLVVAWRRTEAEGRPWAVAIFIVGVVSNFFYFIPHVTAGGQNDLHRFLLVLGAVALVGGVIGLFSRSVGVFRGGWFAIAGNVALFGWLLLLWIWLLAISGHCTPEI